MRPPCGAWVQDEDPHGDAQTLHGFGEPDLILNRPTRHAVVFPRVKAFGRREFELRHRILAGKVAEHAEVRGVAEGERAA